MLDDEPRASTANIVSIGFPDIIKIYKYVYKVTIRTTLKPAELSAKPYALTYIIDDRSENSQIRLTDTKWNN